MSDDVTTEEEMEVLVVNDRENYRGDENFRGEGRFFGHVYATQSGDEDGEDMSPLLENFREDILRMSLTCRRDIYNTSASRHHFFWPPDLAKSGRLKWP